MHPLKYGHLVFFNMHYIKETPHYINSPITDLILDRFLYKHEFRYVIFVDSLIYLKA